MTIQQIVEQQLGDQRYFLDQDVLNKIYELPIMSCNVRNIRQDYVFEPKQLSMKEEDAIDIAKIKVPGKFLDEEIRKYVKVAVDRTDDLVSIVCEMMVLSDQMI